MLLTIRSVQFLSLPVSLTSGEYPLLTSATQDLSSYVLKEYTMNLPEDLQLSVTAPDFALWETCNMVRIADVEGRLYWVVGAEMVTNNQKAVRFALTYCGPSSLIHKNDTAVGVFSRLPENKCPWLPRQPMSSSLNINRWVELPRLGSLGHGDGNTMYAFWVQVTTSNDITESGSSANSQLHRYGFFASVDITGNSYAVYPTGATTATDEHFPSLNSFVSDPERFGFTASAITDVSISCRCPYRYSSGSLTIEGTTYFTMSIDTGEDSQAITAGEGIVYDLTPKIGDWPELVGKTITVNRSDLEQACGTTTLTDEKGNTIATFPPSWGNIQAYIECIPDYGGLTTFITIEGTYRFSIPEGHIPWVGDAWDEYRKYSMAYDRQAMENSIDFANQRVAVGIAQAGASAIQGAAMGAIGGSAAGAVTGAVGGAASFAISTWATLKESDISTAESRATQALAERRVQGSPGTPYNIGYGLIYCWYCIDMPARIQIELPIGLTASIDADYTACFGFPAEGLRSVTFGEGYYKGMLYATSKLKGPRFDKLNQTLQNGFRFKEV